MVDLTKEPFLLDIPEFIPEYQKDVEYGYRGKAGENLEQLLRKTSDNHCMYCYALLKSDRVNTGHMEHSIEKSIDEEYLTECVPNISLACSYCNQSLKRIGEKKRIEAVMPVVKKFEKNLECKRSNCREECGNYNELKKEYCKNAKIILQPMGVKGEQTKCDYRIQYDIYNAEFIPSKNYSYDEEDLAYINHHISQFRLNDKGFKTRELAEFVEDVIEADGKYRKERKYSNYIVDLFMEKIQGMSQKETLGLCEKIHMRNLILFRKKRDNGKEK